MSISSISAATYTPPVSGSSLQSQISQAFKNLVQALQSNNLSAAQQAYNTLTQLVGGQGSSQDSTILFKALSEIGSDLQSGNLSGAQQTLGSLVEQIAQQNSSTQAATQAAGGSSPTGVTSGQALLNATA
jgi:hypothetical protein